MRVSQWLVSASAGVLALSAIPALAQEAPQADAAGAAAGEDTIIVTARRQNERLQDVPASVSVLTAQALANTGATAAADFVNLTPGVTIVTGTAEAGDTQINIRGINGARDAESSVALVVDGILKTNTAQLNQPQGTLQQVEMLKGPQGALYGRNAAAGAIVLQTLKPTDTLTGAVKASYGMYNTIEGTAHVAGPLGGGAGFVLSGYYYKTDGFYHNEFTNNSKTIDDKENWALDGRVMFGQGSPTQVDIKARYAEFHGASLPFNAAFALPNFAGVNPAFYEDVNKHQFHFYNNIRATNDQKSFDASIKLDQELGDNLKLVGWALYSNVNQDLVADGTSADFARYISAADPRVAGAVNSCFASTAALTGYPVNQPGFIGQIPVPFIFAPATGSTFGPYSPTTCDGTQYQLRKQQDFSTEWRLIGDMGDINWQVGAYYLHIKRTVGVSLGADTGNGVIKQLYNAPDSTNPTSLLLADRFKTDVFAGFGSLEYKPSPQFDLGLALRYDVEKRKSSSLVPTVLDPFTGGPINPGQAFGTLQPQKATFKQWEPKVSISWKPTDTLNLYGNWGIGFKSGGFNNQGSAALIKANFVDFINANVNITDRYNKEWSSAFEAGIKGSLLDGKLTFDLAGYYTQVHNMQFFEFFVGSFGLLRVVSNIDKVDIKGVELNVTAKPVRGVKLFGSFNVTDSEIKKNSARPNTIGNKSPYTADYTINAGIEIEQPLNDSLRFFTRTDYRLTGPTWFSSVQNQSGPTLFSGLLPISALGLPAFVGDGKFDRTRRAAFGIVNMRAGVQGDRFSVSVFADNLLDKAYLAEVIPAIEFGGSFISPGGRRLVGVEMGAKF
ncbi:TonB-dependent receptor [Novosphingobium cyanobacteriorum]|uniref:TonB-dependent receptor n=1 Tax=Novosphingobium cyanobacteriorum TaxID=3024215 RepID=A0ABT6CL61_9SPHN|nr:TonB-dependent receptor [Novosphingobium cyanobacteriorum]MDF8334660.1 TonB-dependent receptor [Novosphingobium cyanobacteriorum]